MKEIIKIFHDKTDFPIHIEMCGVSYCDASYRIARPRSKIHCFEYVVSGTGTICTKSGEFHPKEGDVYFLRQWEDHLYFADPVDPWEKIWFNIEGELVDSLLDTYGIKSSGIFPQCPARSLFEEFNKIANSSLSQKSIEKEVSVILHRIIQIMTDIVNTETISYSDDALRLREYINSNYSKPITINELASLIYRSPSQTIRIFRKNFGISPYEYILKRKIQTAKSLLKNTAMSVQQISAELGFNDQHYFSTCFKRKTGLTPGEYRKKK